MDSSEIKPGVYRHYKGQKYQVYEVARHSETEELLVVYRCLYGDYSLWARPLELFTSSVELSNGESVKRFEFVGDSNAQLE